MVALLVLHAGAQVGGNLAHLVGQLAQAERESRVHNAGLHVLVQETVARRFFYRERGAVYVAEQVGHLHARRVLGVHVAHLQVGDERLVAVHEDVADALAHHVLEALADAAAHVERQAVGAALRQVAALQVIGHGLGDHGVVQQLLVELALAGVCRRRVDGEQENLQVVLLEKLARKLELLGGLHLRGLDLGLRGLVAGDGGLELCQVAHQHHGHGEDLAPEAQRARLVQVQAQRHGGRSGKEEHGMPFYACPREDSSATLRPGHHGAGSLAKPGHPCPAAVERELCAHYSMHI